MEETTTQADAQADAQETEQDAEQDAEAQGSVEVLPAVVTEVMPSTVVEGSLARQEVSLQSAAPTLSGGPLAVPTERELRDLMNLGKLFAASGMFPDLKGAAGAVVKILAGRAYGLTPVESQDAFCMVQGRLTKYAKFQAALVKRSGRFDYTIVESTAERCELAFHQLGGPLGEGWHQLGTASFTIKEAQAAGLGRSASGRAGAWQMFPKAMLFARALTQGVTWFCPHLLLGPTFNSSNDDLAAWGEEAE